MDVFCNTFKTDSIDHIAPVSVLSEDSKGIQYKHKERNKSTFSGLTPKNFSSIKQNLMNLALIGLQGDHLDMPTPDPEESAAKLEIKGDLSSTQTMPAFNFEVRGNEAKRNEQTSKETAYTLRKALLNKHKMYPYTLEKPVSNLIKQGMTESDKSIGMKKFINENCAEYKFSTPQITKIDTNKTVKPKLPLQSSTLSQYSRKTFNVSESNSSSAQPPLDACESLEIKTNIHEKFKHLIFGTQISELAFSRYLLLLHKGLKCALDFIKKPEPWMKIRPITLDKRANNTPRKTLLIDLDETLICNCNVREGPDAFVKYFLSGQIEKIPIKFRPYAKTFLKNMSKHYEIIIFTAADARYAQAVIEELDNEKDYISFVLDRSNCITSPTGLFIKDLRVIKNRDLKHMIIIDNLLHSFALQLDNGIPIIEWRGDNNDKELIGLEKYLIDLARYDDLPRENSIRLKLGELANVKIENLL